MVYSISEKNGFNLPYTNCKSHVCSRGCEAAELQMFM